LLRVLCYIYRMTNTERVVCRECGLDYNHRKTLMQHVKVLHKMKFDDYNRKYGLEQGVCHCGKPLPKQKRAKQGGGRTRKHCSPECNQMANSFKRNYKITPETYYEHLKAGCAICGSTISLGGLRRLAVDHNHLTGKFRGVLCSNCNTAIGYFKDSLNLLQRAIIYLQKA